MKKTLKIILLIISILISIIILDTIQAVILKNSPIISWKSSLNDSWIDRGILIDTYYCVKETDIVTVSHHFKTSKFTCPIDHIEIINEPVPVTELDGISMKIKEGTLTKTGATIIITDTTGKENTYGSSYHLDKLNNYRWQTLDVIYEGNYGFISIGYMVDENNQLELKHDWKLLYGELESGTYRLVKEVNNKYFAVEFKID